MNKTVDTDIAVLTGCIRPEVSLVGHIHSVATLTGRIRPEVSLIGHVCPKISLIGNICQEVRLTGHILPEVSLVGSLGIMDGIGIWPTPDATMDEGKFLQLIDGTPTWASLNLDVYLVAIDDGEGNIMLRCKTKSENEEKILQSINGIPTWATLDIPLNAVNDDYGNVEVYCKTI